MRKIIVLLAILTSSCAPTPIAMSQDSISIKYDPATSSQDEVLAQAENYCETMKKKAVFRATTEEGMGLGFHYSHFDCVKR